MGNRRDAEFIEYLEQVNRELLEDVIGLNQPLIQNISDSLKLASYKPKKYFDSRPPKRLPRFFKNGYLSTYCPKHAILGYHFLPEKLRKGCIFDVNPEHSVFIDSEDFVIVNVRVIYPRYKLKMKKMSNVRLLDDALSFYYALYDAEDKKLTLKTIKIVFNNTDAKTLTKIAQLLESSCSNNMKSLV